MHKEKPQQFAPDFLLVPYPVYQDERLEGLDRVVYGIVYYFEKMKDGVCFASNQAIADLAGKANPKAVGNALDRLEKCGYITREYKDEARRNRVAIHANVSFKERATKRASPVSMERDTRLDGTHDTRLDGQNDNKGNSNKDTYSSARGAEQEKLIADIIDQFKMVNPSHRLLFARKPQREAVARLLEQFGAEKLYAMVRYLPTSNADRFAPTITTPIELEKDLGRLIAWSQKRKQATGGKGIASTVPTDYEDNHQQV